MLNKLKPRSEFSFNILTLMADDRIEQLESNNYKSKTRNKLIALMFKECGCIEKYGSGIGRIKKFCKVHNIIEPKFEEMQKGFQVTLYKEKISEINSNEGINEGINSLYLCIKNYPALRVSQIEEKLNIPGKTLERWIKKLRDDHKIEYRGSKKTGGYYVKF